ncbi:hypothetical protein KL86DPRO_20296 [uncultured delta proteobacterium]|uniref:Lipoyl-binding domain-containing protein n=1 Tax=uncultured delta proteobacterium TaxID=34034 RepID=A0A212JXV3_9DELT|nr:hypothetical protein KL86DPRO_20296 [uncultured delta proteobacterium]
MQIVMPQIGMTMTEGTIVEWKKKDGDPVEKGEILYVIQTEKLENEIEAIATGTLKIIVPEGESAECGVVIGEIVE